MNAFAHVSGWLLIVATIVGSVTLTYLVVRRRPQRPRHARGHLASAALRLRWSRLLSPLCDRVVAARGCRCGVQGIRKCKLHKHLTRIPGLLPGPLSTPRPRPQEPHPARHVVTVTDLTEEPPDDWSPKREWGDRPFRTNLDRPTHPPLWQPATPRDTAFPGWNSPLIAAIAVTRVPQPLRNGGWNPVVPDTTWNRVDQQDLNARLDWDRMLNQARVS